MTTHELSRKLAALPDVRVVVDVTDGPGGPVDVDEAVDGHLYESKAADGTPWRDFAEKGSKAPWRPAAGYADLGPAVLIR